MKPKLEKIVNLNQLHALAKKSKRYQNLVIAASENLGGPTRHWKEGFDYLTFSTMDTSPIDILKEVNLCRNFI